MQYIPDGAAQGLNITNQAAAGLSSTIDQIGRRRRVKSSQMFSQGQVLGNDRMMAEAANMNSSENIKPRTFIDTLGNEYAGTYDEVRMAAYKNYLAESRGKSMLEKIRLGREFQGFLVDPNRVYDRQKGIMDDTFKYVDEGKNIGSGLDKRGLNYYHNGELKYLVYPSTEGGWQDARNRESAKRELKAQGYDNKTIEKILSDPKNFTPNLPTNAASSNKQAAKDEGRVSGEVIKRLDAADADDEISGIVKKYERTGPDAKIPNNKIVELNKKYKGVYTFRYKNGLLNGNRIERVKFDPLEYEEITGEPFDDSGGVAQNAAPVVESKEAKLKRLRDKLNK